MVVYINHDNSIEWLHDDNAIKEQYLNDDRCIVVDKALKFLTEPENEFIYVQKFDTERQEIYLECVGEKPKPPATLEEVREMSTMTSEDALMIIEYLMILEEKIDALSVK